MRLYPPSRIKESEILHAFLHVNNGSHFTVPLQKEGSFSSTSCENLSVPPSAEVENVALARSGMERYSFARSGHRQRLVLGWVRNTSAGAPLLPARATQGNKELRSEWRHAGRFSHGQSLPCLAYLFGHGAALSLEAPKTEVPLVCPVGRQDCSIGILKPNRSMASLKQ
jgi:hypothetical protein